MMLVVIITIFTREVPVLSNFTGPSPTSSIAVMLEKEDDQQGGYQPHCQNFQEAPNLLNWESLYALEWNGTPAILSRDEIDTKSGRFPSTQFSAHVQELVNLIDLDSMESSCIWKFTLSINNSNQSSVDLFCQGKARQRMVPWWCKVLERLFLAQRSSPGMPAPDSANIQCGDGEYMSPELPGSVSFAVSSDDYHKTSKKQRQSQTLSPYTCFENSSRNGTFAITNFLEIQRMADRTSFPIIPWHQRCSTPIWRGSAWILGKSGGDYETGYKEDHPILHQALVDCLRCRAVEFSNVYPNLFDAKFGDPKNGFFHPAVHQYVDWWEQNATNGLNRLLPIHHIPPAEYYSHYQVAVVLCGLGAAFRTPIHLSTATAVVLQECSMHEWYHPWFVPWRHFIPLKNDLSDLKDITEWVIDHPEEVHKIAREGRRFYERYLSFQRNYEHFYEMIFRLALKKKDSTENRGTLL